MWNKMISTKNEVCAFLELRITWSSKDFQKETEPEVHLCILCSRESKWCRLAHEVRRLLAQKRSDGDKSDKEFAGKKTWRRRRRRRLGEREWVFVSLWKLKTLTKARLILSSIFLCFLFFLILVWFDLIWCRLQNMNGLLPGASQLVIERAT